MRGAPEQVSTDPDDDHPVDGARLVERPWFPVAAFAVVALVLVLVTWASERHLSLAPYYQSSWNELRSYPGDGFLRGWVRWDGGWYERAAVEGYAYTPGVPSTVAFFPLYPLLMRALDPLAPHIVVAGMAITLASGLAIAVGFHRWCRSRMGATAAATALGALLLYPFSFFLVGQVYGDALFVALAVAAFVAVDRDRVLLAGCLGALATATRPVGFALVVGLILAVAERRDVLPPPAVAWRALRRGAVDATVVRARLRRFRRGDAAIGLSVAGLAAWSTFLWVRFGNPLLFYAAEDVPGWSNGAGMDTWFKLRLWRLVTGEAVEPAGYLPLAVFEGLLAIAFVAAVPALLRRFGWAAGVYVFLAVFPAVFALKDFHPAGRFLLAAFPVFALVGVELDERPRLRVGALAASGALLVWFTSLSARGYWIG